MKIGDFLNNLSKKANVPSEIMKDVLSNPALASIDLSDAFTEAVDASLMNEEQAKFNPNLKTHFTGTVHKTLANLIDPFANEIEDEDFKTSFLSEANNFKKIPNLIAKMKELSEAKVKAASTGKAKDVEEVTRQYNELQALRKQEQERFNSELENERQGFTSKLKDMSLNSMLSGYNFIDELPKDVAGIVAREKLNATLAAKGAAMVYDSQSNSLRLVNANDLSLPYRENHNEMSLTDFANRTLAENKLLKVTGAAPAPTPRTQQQAPAQAPQGGGLRQPQRDVSVNHAIIEQMKSAQ